MTAAVIPYPREWLAGAWPHLDQSRLQPEHYRRLGVCVLRQVVPSAVVAQWQQAWADFRDGQLKDGRQVDPYNPVVLHETVSGELARIHEHPVLLDLMQQIYPDLALYVQRFVIKDAQSRNAVFLHQDCCYDLGWPEKTSIFLPLSPMNAANGGLALYPGTHLLGYLGDAGELNREVLAADWPVVQPDIQPGDLLLMHECTWHESSAWSSGPDRILLQITYQPASDPGGIKVLRGHAPFGTTLGDIDRERIFLRSRTSRLRELQQQLGAAGHAKSHD